LKNIHTIIFDADDTLWVNNIYFVEATEAFLDLFERNGFDRDKIHQAFLATEKQVVQEHGYGSDNFIMILKRIFNRYRQQAGIQEIHLEKIIQNFNTHRENPPKLFPGVKPTLEKLCRQADLYLLTKGQQDEQAQKVEHSGLKSYFKKCFILPEKDDMVYARLIRDNHFIPDQTCMVGNSPKSDINPALRNGLYAVWIPYAHTWHLDNEGVLTVNGRMRQIESITQLPEVIMGGGHDA